MNIMYGDLHFILKIAVACSDLFHNFIKGAGVSNTKKIIAFYFIFEKKEFTKCFWIYF